jgi:hypothetical protein
MSSSLTTMGYFANLYVLEANANGADIATRTTIYGNEIGAAAYFCWGPGERPNQLHSYANGTMLCDTELKSLPGYPLEERSENSTEFLIEANFQPRRADDPVLFHLILPKRFIPRRDMKPLEQPNKPFLYTTDDRIVATYPSVGTTAIRFWITRIGEQESLADYDLHKLLHPDEERPTKIGFEFNLGIFKLKYG